MPPFIGRERELRLLESAWQSADSAFIPLYGRRRVGKSELILHFLERHPGLYFLGKQAPARLQLQELLELAAGMLDEPLLASSTFDGWKAALAAIVDRWRGPGKLVIALDEFQWMVEASPELPSALQELWDRRWRDSGRVMLLLCGSYLGFMEREVLGQQSPLFGRRTAQIHLKPFGYLEARRFHPRLSLQEATRTYLVCGGIPLYLKAFSEDCSFEQNIRRCLLDEFAPLYQEPHFLLREELREVRNYYAILLALAAGAGSAPELSRKTGVPERSLTYYLNHLIELGYLERRHPLTGARPNAREVRYRVSDPLLRFWFRFVYPNTSLIAHAGAEKTFATRIQPELGSYLGLCFEGLCREALPRLYQLEGITAAFEIGEYWDRQTQIDVVGVRDDDRIDLGECRWGAIRSTRAVIDEVQEKRRRFPNPLKHTLQLRVFSRTEAPKPDAASGIRWHDLEALYELGAGAAVLDSVSEPRGGPWTRG
jgi:hypothetical protein